MPASALRRWLCVAPRQPDASDRTTQMEPVPSRLSPCAEAVGKVQHMGLQVQ
jgi:hypothetical protein